MEYENVRQPFEPVYDKNSKILILGSLPSVKSREQGFYYGHKQNRFWRVMAGIFESPLPETIEQKKELLLRNHVAIYDVIESCDIKGSSDSSIRNVVPADLRVILHGSQIEVIFANGKAAGKLFQKYQAKNYNGKFVELPSTSPANAAFSLERLMEIWGAEIRGYR
ncbi:MAG: DNA-deoxyinosine glycosylase [Lachnospiraceae bacterium]|nr:DNA-deoxyinosine glycosylase [Lachnospiraceae bacterium]